MTQSPNAQSRESRNICPLVFFFTAVKFSCLSGVVVARGDTTGTFPGALKQGLSQKIRSALNFVDWNPFPLDVWTGKKEFVHLVLCLSNPFMVLEFMIYEALIFTAGLCGSITSFFFFTF